MFVTLLSYQSPLNIPLVFHKDTTQWSWSWLKSSLQWTTHCSSLYLSYLKLVYRWSISPHWLWVCWWCSLHGLHTAGYSGSQHNLHPLERWLKEKKWIDIYDILCVSPLYMLTSSILSQINRGLIIKLNIPYQFVWWCCYIQKAAKWLGVVSFGLSEKLEKSYAYSNHLIENYKKTLCFT